MNGMLYFIGIHHAFFIIHLYPHSNQIGRQERDGATIPFSVIPLFLFPLDVQIHRTANNHQA
jgi:hypothetical protein